MRKKAKNLLTVGSRNVYPPFMKKALAGLSSSACCDVFLPQECGTKGLRKNNYPATDLNGPKIFTREEIPMTQNVVIVLSCGTDNPNRSTRGIHLATVSHKEGKNVKVFFLDEAVNLVKKGMIDNLKAATGDVADDLMTYLQTHEVPLLTCTPCAKARQIGEEDLIEGARMATAMELIEICCDDAVVISL